MKPIDFLELDTHELKYSRYKKRMGNTSNNDE